MWQNDTEKYLFANPELVEALKNPARIFNQDETAVQVRKTSWILLEILQGLRVAQVAVTERWP